MARRQKSLKNQLRYALTKSSRIGQSKRADKRNGVKTENYIYSNSLRIGELMVLHPSDFDFSFPKLSVTRNLQIVNGQKMFLEPKTKKS